MIVFIINQDTREVFVEYSGYRDPIKHCHSESDILQVFG